MAEAREDDWVITDEQRTRYDALFYSQNPVIGLLTGEKARDLFLKSKLPLQTLSQIWKLCDINHDNMLDANEFAIAMHLMNYKLRGKKIPQSLPECLIPETQPASDVPVMTGKEREAYLHVFKKHDKLESGYLKADYARNMFLSSKLPVGALAQVWNLSDIDRDGQLDSDEFAIALHLLRFLRRGNQIQGSINVLEMLPDKLPSSSVEAKRRKIAEVEIQKQKLCAVKERKQLEMVKDGKRVELEREKIRVKKMRIAVQREQWSTDKKVLQLSEIEQEEKTLTTDSVNLEKLEKSLSGLATEHEKLVEEEIRLNLEEERLQTEKRLLEKEADEIKQEAERNKLHKEIDPFHSLHEKRKEERKKGIIIPLSSLNPDVPEAPFDNALSNHRQLTGKDLFSGPAGISTAFPENIFEDNFVDPVESIPADSFCVQLDTEFKTVSVTAEEDNLWSSTPDWSNQNDLFESAPGTTCSSESTYHQEVPNVIVQHDDSTIEDELNQNPPGISDQSTNQKTEYSPVEKDEVNNKNETTWEDKSVVLVERIDTSELSKGAVDDNSGNAQQWEDFFSNDNPPKTVSKTTEFDLLGGTTMDVSLAESEGTHQETSNKQSNPFEDDDDSFYITPTKQSDDKNVDDYKDVGQLIDFGEPDVAPKMPQSSGLPFYMRNDDFGFEEEESPKESSFGFEDSGKTQSPKIIDLEVETSQDTVTPDFNSFSFDVPVDNDGSHPGTSDDEGVSPKLPTSAPPTKDDLPSQHFEDLPPDFYGHADAEILPSETTGSEVEEVLPSTAEVEVAPQEEKVNKEEMVVHSVTTGFVKSYQCDEDTVDASVDEHHIDKDALIRQWEMSLSINTNAAAEDEAPKKKYLQPRKKKINVYLDPNPKFKKKDSAKESEEPVVVLPTKESDLHRDTMNIIAMQKAKKGNTQLTWNLNDKKEEEEEERDSLTADSMKHYEERKQKQELKMAQPVSGKPNNSLYDSRDSGLGDTWKSQADEPSSPERHDPAHVPVNRQNGNYQPEHEVDTSKIDRAALLEQWKQKLMAEKEEDLHIEAHKEKERRIREEIQKEADAESIADPAKTRQEWEKRLSLRKGVEPPQFSRVYTTKAPKVEEDELKPKKEVTIETQQEDEMDAADVQEEARGYHDSSSTDEESEPPETYENETIVQREIRLQKQKEKELQKELDAAHRFVKQDVAMVESVPVVREDVDLQEEIVPQSPESDDYSEERSASPETVEDEEENLKMTKIQREIREQRQREEELLRQGRVKHISVPSYDIPEREESETKPKRMESIIEREMREQREREEMLRIERGLPATSPEEEDLYLSMHGSRPVQDEDESSSSDEKNLTPETEIKDSSSSKEKQFTSSKQYPIESKQSSSISVSKTIFERHPKPALAEESRNYHDNSASHTPKMPQQKKKKEVILVEQEQIQERNYEEETVKPEYIPSETSREYQTEEIMEEPEKPLPPRNESIVEREIRLQREREEELQKQRLRAGIGKTSVATVAEVKKSPKPVPEVNDVDGVADSPPEPVSRTAQARALFSKPTKLPEEKPSKEVYAKYSVTATAAATPTRDVKINNSTDSNFVNSPNENVLFETPKKEETLVEEEKPRKETPIEREIRLAREKEMSYRKERGLPLMPRHEKQHISESKKKSDPVEEAPKSTFSEYQPPESSAKDQYMKRAAVYYMEKEMEENRQKEEELKKEGKIRRLSTRSKEDEDERDSRMRNGPKGESIVEREIRLQREREELYKQEHEGSQRGRPSDLQVRTQSVEKMPTHVKSDSSNASSASLSPPSSPLSSQSDHHQPQHHHRHKAGYAQYMSNVSASVRRSSREEEVQQVSEETSFHENKEPSKPVKRRSLLAAQWEDKFK